MNIDHILAFDDDAAGPRALAHALGSRLAWVDRHRFPDGEVKLRLPPALDGTVVIWRGLQQPDAKLVELMIAAPAARELGARTLVLVCPYLAYMRQDAAFVPGEAVSQRHVGRFLAGLFDRVVTIDPHLHRTPSLGAIMPGRLGVVLSAAGLLGAHAARAVADPLLLGPDAESAPWVASAAAAGAAAIGAAWPLEHACCVKQRDGDHQVRVTLPPGLALRGRAVVLIDDVASTGRTLAAAAAQCHAQGALSVDVAVTHALFVGNALEALDRAGVRHVWSTDAIPHASNAISIVPLVADALRGG